MTDFALTVRSDRIADQALLLGTVANVDGAQANHASLPVDLGDCLILEAELFIASIATAPDLGANRFAAWFSLWDNAKANIVDIIGTGELFKVYDGAANEYLACHVMPDQLVYWKNGELMQVFTPELDTNATPTGDWRLAVKVRRLRQTTPERHDPRFLGRIVLAT